MRMLMHVKLPLEPMNTHIRDGGIKDLLERILAEAKPEAVYFTEYHGRRGVVLIVDVTDASAVPSLAEPWFLCFNADVEFHVAMTPDDLARSGLDALGKKWG